MSSRLTAEILNELKLIKEHMLSIEAVQVEINQSLTRVAMEQISQRESQFRLERRVINHVKETVDEAPRG